VVFMTSLQCCGLNQSQHSLAVTVILQCFDTVGCMMWQTQTFTVVYIKDMV